MQWSKLQTGAVVRLVHSGNLLTSRTGRTRTHHRPPSFTLRCLCLWFSREQYATETAYCTPRSTVRCTTQHYGALRSTVFLSSIVRNLVLREVKSWHV